jgi:hypothetical protein
MNALKCFMKKIATGASNANKHSLLSKCVKTLGPLQAAF